MKSLAVLEHHFESVDLEGCSDELLAGLVRDVHSGRRQLEGYLARITVVVDQRESEGVGPATSDVMRSGGEVSKDEADRLTRRVAIGDLLADVGSNLEAGKCRGDNVDAVARALDRLSSSERKRLAVFDSEIAERAGCLPPETFNRYLGRLVSNIKDRDEPATAEKQKADSYVNMGRKANGMWWLCG